MENGPSETKRENQQMPIHSEKVEKLHGKIELWF